MRISDWSSDVCSSDLQFPGEGREHLAIDTTSAEWRAAAPGAELLGLYRDDRYPEDIVMLRLTAGSRLPPQMIDAAAAPHGLEIFVVSGGLVADGARSAAGAWLREPHGIAKHFTDSADTTLYIKRTPLGGRKRGQRLASSSRPRPAPPPHTPNPH